MADKFSHKLYHYAEVPPASAWKAIEGALDDTVVTNKLFSFETTPPAHIWEQIVLQLPQHDAKVVPIRGAKVFKYAIAAAVLIAFAAGSFYYFNKGASQDFASQAPSKASADETKNAGSFSPEADLTPTNQSETATTDNNISDNAPVHFSASVHIAKTNLATRPTRIIPAEKNIINTELPDRYMIATTRQGRVVRLPKKAYSDYACAQTGNNYQCKEKIASLQNKMAASVATDFTNFMDLLENLQEN